MEQPMQIGQPLTSKHSGLGIASFIISLLTGILMCVAIGGATILQASSGGAIRSNTTVMAILGLFILALIFACLVALGLGIGALFQKNRKRVFGVLGIVISAATIVIWIALEIIGLSRL
jgi:hypothetical protein